MILRTDYAAHELFIAPARARSQLWRVALCLVVGFMTFLALNLPYAYFVYATYCDTDPDILQSIEKGQTPTTMLLLFANFGLLVVALALAVALVHRRNPLTLVGNLNLAVPQFFKVAFFLALLGIAIIILPPWDMGGELQPGLPFGTWLSLLPLSLLGLLVQVSIEELIFRGYLQQQLAVRFNSKLLWMVLPSVLFGALHYTETAGDNALLVAIWASVFGILMADLTARAGSLGPAIAVHFCNNFSALLIVSLPDQLSGLSLYLAPLSMEDPEVLRGWLYVDFVTMFVGWLAARLALRR